MESLKYIICPNCGFDRNNVVDQYCQVCAYPFEKMDGWGHIIRNSPTNITPKNTRQFLINFTTWFMFTLLVYGVIHFYYLYKSIVCNECEASTFKSIIGHKDRTDYAAVVESEVGDSVNKQQQETGNSKNLHVTQIGGSGEIGYDEDVDVKEASEMGIELQSVETPGFIIYCNDDAIRLELSQKVDNMFNEIVKDLGFFSAMTSNAKIKLYIFNTAEDYHKYSQLPRWSSGYAAPDKLSIYLYISDRMNLILPHEISHLIFKLFIDDEIELGEFAWLIEGIAVYAEIKNNQNLYKNFDSYIKQLAKDSKIQKLEELVKYKVFSAPNDEAVRIWYMQSGSLVKYIISQKGSMSFYNFCNGLKIFKGDLNQALNYAFSGEFNTIADLEKRWLTYIGNQ